MYYCFKCNIAGDIGRIVFDHDDYSDQIWEAVVCYNCGGELHKESYEWIKKQGATEISKVQREEVEIEWP